MAEIFQPADGVRIAVFGREDDLAPETVHQTALARDAELGGERGMDVRDDFQGHCFVGGLLHENRLLLGKNG